MQKSNRDSLTYQFVSYDACVCAYANNKKTLPYIYLNLAGNPLSLTKK